MFVVEVQRSMREKVRNFQSEKISKIKKMTMDVRSILFDAPNSSLVLIAAVIVLPLERRLSLTMVVVVQLSSQKK